MFILGLTGSIGMGKSTTAGMFRAAGAAVYDADAAVHALYQGEAVPLIAAAFPGAVVDGRVDRQHLSAILMANPEASVQLEAIVHPLVRKQEKAFLARVSGKASVVVLDIPLLLETGGEMRCDAVVVVTAPAEVQRARVLARPGMTPELFERLLARQMDDGEKRRRAHFLVDTGRGMASAEAQVGAILRAIAGRSGRVTTNQVAQT
jgi:dephospho-CoA kinase